MVNGIDKQWKASTGCYQSGMILVQVLWYLQLQWITCCVDLSPLDCIVETVV